MVKFDQLVAELSVMSPDNIAEYLLKEGIEGNVGEGDDCPLANYFKQKIRPECPTFKIWVDGENISISNGENRDIKPPQSLSDFVQNFDGGHYPLLKRPEEEEELEEDLDDAEDLY